MVAMMIWSRGRSFSARPSTCGFRVWEARPREEVGLQCAGSSNFGVLAPQWQQQWQLLVQLLVQHALTRVQASVVSMAASCLGNSLMSLTDP